MASKNLWETRTNNEFEVNHEEISELLDSRYDFLRSKIENLNESIDIKPVKYVCEYDPAKDANIYMMSAVQNGINTLGIVDYHKKVMERMDPELRELIESHSPTDEALPTTIANFLEQRYLPYQEQVNNYLESLTEAFTQASPKIVRNLQTLYGAEFKFDEVNVYVSTSPTCPYNAKEGNFAISAYGGFRTDFRSPIDIGLHEMNHFMFAHSKYPAMLEGRLSREETDLIKETLTYFTKPDDPDTRPAEIPLKNLYSSQNWESLDQVVEAAANFIILHRANTENA